MTDHTVEAKMFLSKVQELAKEYTEKTGETVHRIDFNVVDVYDGCANYIGCKYGCATLASKKAQDGWMHKFENGKHILSFR